MLMQQQCWVVAGSNTDVRFRKYTFSTVSKSQQGCVVHTLEPKFPAFPAWMMMGEILKSEHTKARHGEGITDFIIYTS